MQKSLLYFSLVILAGISFISCGDDECSAVCQANQVLDINCDCVDLNSSSCAGVTCEPGEILTSDCECVTTGDQSEVIVSSNITSNETWTSDKIWILSSRVTVESGATLTIEPGTVIKGQAGQGTNATALLVARGARINAVGSANAPIIFTSVADEIVSGQISSPNLAPNTNGLWGGVMILGYAPISADAEAVQIEGVPPSDQNGLYGGTDPLDNSGIFTYVSIRHGGTDIGEGNEINGLTLGGVGSGTIIDHVEIVGNVDDGIEFFGGSVNCTNLLVMMQGDDAFDGDQGYSGTVDNFVNIAGAASDHSLEFDGPEGMTDGSYTFVNGTCKGWNNIGRDGGEYADFRSDLRCSLSNVYFFNYSDSSDFELDNDGVAANYFNGLITTSGLEFNVDHLSAGNLTCEDIMADKSTAGDAFNQINPGCNVVSSATVGANTSEFHSWTWAHDSGLLDF